MRQANWLPEMRSETVHGSMGPDGRSPAWGRAWGWGAILLFSVVLLWPTLVTGSALIFNDSFYYVGRGEIALSNMLERLLPPTPGVADTVAATVDATGAADGGGEGAKVRRSLPYQMFAGLTAATIPTHGLLTVWIQSLVLTLFMALLLDRDMLAKPRAVAAAGFVLAFLTALPFYASLLMPDVLVALIIMNAMLILRGVERLTFLQWGFVFLATSFAVVSHHGHLPVAGALAAVVLLVLLLRRRLHLSAVLLALGPLVVAILANMTVSVAVYDEVSAAPKRFPILLARSMADGPARWYLEEACPEAGYRICDRIDALPRHLGGILWDEDGIIKGSSAEDLDRMRAEEPEILVKSFLAYPVQQGWSLAGNSVLQMMSIGLDDLVWEPLRRAEDGSWWVQWPDRPDRRGMDEIATVQAFVVIAAALYIGWIVLRRRLDAGRREADMLLVLLAGLAVNAIIFGGLSAPADRYQGRIIWLVPMLASLFWLARRQTGADHAYAGKPLAAAG